MTKSEWDLWHSDSLQVKLVAKIQVAKLPFRFCYF